MRGPVKTALVAVLVSSLIAPGCVEELLELLSTDEYEPNDTHAEAADITDSHVVNADFILDTVDWYVVETTDDVEFSVAVTPLGSISDITVTLYDGGENWLADDDDGAADSNAQTIVYPAPGSSGNPIFYYIEVEYTGSADAELYGLVWTTP